MGRFVFKALSSPASRVQLLTKNFGRQGLCFHAEHHAAGSVPGFVKGVYIDGSGHFCVSTISSATPSSEIGPSDLGWNLWSWSSADFEPSTPYLIRKGFCKALDGKAADRIGYALYCFEHLRQSILCAADATWEPFRSRFKDTGGKGVDVTASLHQCWNFDQVYECAERFRYYEDRAFEVFEG
ncbi:hypothetical protein MMC27_003031 [Xylographa pallens]|nr:hypothetical protein [Xylographa pallens]